MKDKGLLIFVVGVFLFLVICSFFVFALFDLQKSDEKFYIENNSGKISCENDLSCDDGNSCTLDYCNEMNNCVNSDVVLCYHNDGCCPNGCTPENDNDC